MVNVVWRLDLAEGRQKKVKLELYELRIIENALHDKILTLIALNGSEFDNLYLKTKLAIIEDLRHKINDAITDKLEGGDTV